MTVAVKRDRPAHPRALFRRATARLVRGTLARWTRGGRRAAGERGDTVYLLLMHAWGMGGTIRTALSIAEHLGERHSVEILSLVRRRDLPLFEFPAGVTVTAIDDQRPAARGGPLRRLLRARPSVLMHRSDRASRACSLWTDVAFARAMRRRPAGVLITTRVGLNLLAADVAGPDLVTVGQEHMHLSAHPERQQRAMAARYPALDALVVLTDGDRRAYEEVFGDTLQVARIPNAVPRLPARREHAPGGNTILAAGRLTRQKGFDLLIPAFARVAPEHPDWNLRICGKGPQRKVLKRLIEEYGLRGRVSLPGPVRGLAGEMASASLFVISSRYEGFPMVLLEAMGAGLPVVSFDCPTGPREIVEDRVSGRLVTAGDVDGLAAALDELIVDEGLRRRYAAEAARTAERYSMDFVGPQWESLLGTLLASRAGVGREVVAPGLSVSSGRRRRAGSPTRR
jgi:glycosyltransferase involved in cell wall biosynthesis